MAALMASSTASPYPASFSTAQRFHNLNSSTSAICFPAINSKNAALQFPRFLHLQRRGIARLQGPSSSVLACLPSSSSSSDPPSSAPKTRLYISGLSFRTTEEGLRKAFENFGRLVEGDDLVNTLNSSAISILMLLSHQLCFRVIFTVNLVMDKIARRPRGFAFLRYTTEEESQKAIEGMHGKGDIRGSCESQIGAS
ncbi:Organelle RRM domain-containing protein 6, chloroplastic [Linum perenne]